MRHSTTTICLVVAVTWQIIVFVLSSAGIFGDIYWLLGIPWNSTGIINVFGTTIGLVLLEMPLLAVICLVLRRFARRPDDCDDRRLRRMAQLASSCVRSIGNPGEDAQGTSNRLIETFHLSAFLPSVLSARARFLPVPAFCLRHLSAFHRVPSLRECDTSAPIPRVQSPRGC